MGNCCGKRDMPAGAQTDNSIGQGNISTAEVNRCIEYVSKFVDQSNFY